MKFFILTFILISSLYACKFEIGDEVVLKSEGIPMTVVDVDTTKCKIYVVFFDAGFKFYQLSFDEKVLKLHKKIKK